MGLRFTDALRLSWSNIAQHKKQSAVIVITISVLFGTIMSFNSLMSGIEKTALDASAGQTGGETYIIATRERDADFSKIINDPAELTTELLEPVLDSAEENKIKKRAEQYGGEIVGYWWHYQLDYPYQVITASAMSEFITTKLNQVPSDKVPVMMPEDWELPSGADSTRKRIGDSFERVGVIPGTELELPTLPGPNPLNLILSGLPHGVDERFWLVDDGSGKITAFMESQLKRYLAEDNGWFSTASIQKSPVIKFGNPSQAIAFTESEDKVFGVSIYTPDAETYGYTFRNFPGTTLMAAKQFNMLRVFLLFIEAVLLVVAVIVAVVTFAHLIDGDAQTIVLYRAMGASTGGVLLVYFLYLLELGLLAILACGIITLSVSGILALISASTLAAKLQVFYHLDYLPQTDFLNLNEMSILIILIILSIAPLALLFTIRHFSVRHIAKKLKED